MHKMKTVRLTILLVLLVLLVFLKTGQSGDFVKYAVQVHEDGTATWQITQVLDVNSSIDSWNDFQERILSLVNVAENLTGREMSILQESIQMGITISWETRSKTVVYTFTWVNFTVVNGNQETIGDVFGVTDFFTRLYGDGSLQLSYPESCAVVQVSPVPNEQDNASRTFTWYRTVDFITGKPKIVLRFGQSELAAGPSGALLASVGLGMVAVASSIMAVVYLVKKRKATKTKSSGADELTRAESEENKILEVLKANGRPMQQSLIVEKCGFSKAKASQLLKALEQRGIVRRYKRGRDKIVVLTSKKEEKT